MKIPVNQHYVPQFLLRNFHNQNEKIYVFDKHTKKTFETIVRNVAAERNYYNFSSDGVTFSLEAPLSKVEGEARSLIDLIIKNEKLGVLTEDDCSLLALFISIQHFRGPRMRSDQEVIAQALLERFGDTPEGRIMIEKEWPVGKENAKNFAIHFVATAAHKHIPFFLNKNWILFKCMGAQNFVISDTPVVLFNDNDFGPYGNLGLAVRGIRIFFPISSKFALGFYCTSIKEEFQKGIFNYEKLSHDDVQIKEDYAHAIKEAKIYIAATESGLPMSLSDENVLHMNALQIGFSERFIFSEADDFELARKMTEKGPVSWGRIKLD